MISSHVGSQIWICKAVTSVVDWYGGFKSIHLLSTSKWEAKHRTSLKFQPSTQLIAHCSNPRQLNIMSSALRGSWSGQFSPKKKIKKPSCADGAQTGWNRPDLTASRPADWTQVTSGQFSRTTWNAEKPNVLFNLTRFRSSDCWTLFCRALLLQTETNTVLIRSVPRKGRDWVHALYCESKDKPFEGIAEQK